MSHTTPTSGAYSLPPQRRRGGWRRAAKAVALLAVLVGALLAAWVGVNEHQSVKARDAYLARRDALRAAGEPVLPSDVSAMHAVPDERNAVIPLRRAAARVPPYPEQPTDADRDDWINLPFIVPLTARERELVGTRLVTLPAIEADVREAAARGGADWQHRFDVPMLQMLYPELSQQRELANVLDHGALLATDDRSYDVALDRAALILPVGAAMRHHPSTVGFLVSVGIESLGLNRIVDVAVRMPVGAGEKGAADPAAVRRLIRTLRDESGMNAAIRDAILADRTQATESMELLATYRMGSTAAPTWWGRIGNRFARPSLYQAGSTMLDEWSAAHRAMAAPDWPTALAGLPSKPPSDDRSRDAGSLLLQVMRPTFRRVAAQHYSIVAQRRLTAVALAVRLYRADHDDRLPAALADLVPAYLPSVPVDPMAADGAAVRYVPGPDRPRMYSIGTDGVDDGGRERNELPRTPEVRARPFDAGDIVVALSPKLRPAIQPAGDDAPADRAQAAATGPVAP